jgi:hypothetical protein
MLLSLAVATAAGFWTRDQTFFTKIKLGLDLRVCLIKTTPDKRAFH